jgi:chromosome partitioning protein
VRKLLVASQKGGVGKTTTSINLAAATAQAGTRVLLLDADPVGSVGTALNLANHPQRQPLRKAGIELPGALVADVIPGLDVLSPYEEGSCSDEELDDLLRVVAAPPFQECYGCLIVGAPPFLGANPGQLLAAADEFVLVMRAEPMAYRTLPAFLELVQRLRQAARDLPMRGILLTLPEGEIPGGRWERELRGRFGGRILPQVIPYDEEVARAMELGQVAVHANPNASAVQQYRQLAQHLGLASELRVTVAARVTAALLEAASVLQTAAVGGRESAVATAVLAPPGEPESPPAFSPPAAETIEDRPSALPPTVGERVAPREPRRRWPSGLRPALPPAPPSAALSRRSAAPLVPPQEPPVPAPPPAAARKPLRDSAPLWPLWLVIAVFVGVGLRFVLAPANLIPILVGVVVTVVVVLLLWFGLNGQEQPRRAPLPPSKPPSKPPTPTRLKSDVATRLNALTRRPNRSGRRDLRGS